MNYSIMKLICMFDLPTETSMEKRIYRRFRKGLIAEGFTMIQYSIYVRTCPSREYVHRLENRVKKIVPKSGNVRLLTVTEKQYNDMLLLVGSKTHTERILSNKRIIVI